MCVRQTRKLLCLSYPGFTSTSYCWFLNTVTFCFRFRLFQFVSNYPGFLVCSNVYNFVQVFVRLLTDVRFCFTLFQFSQLWWAVQFSKMGKYLSELFWDWFWRSKISEVLGVGLSWIEFVCVGFNWFQCLRVCFTCLVLAKVSLFWPRFAQVFPS